MKYFLLKLSLVILILSLSNNEIRGQGVVHLKSSDEFFVPRSAPLTDGGQLFAFLKKDGKNVVIDHINFIFKYTETFVIPERSILVLEFGNGELLTIQAPYIYSTHNLDEYDIKIKRGFPVKKEHYPLLSRHKLKTIIFFNGQSKEIVRYKELDYNTQNYFNRLFKNLRKGNKNGFPTQRKDVEYEIPKYRTPLLCEFYEKYMNKSYILPYDIFPESVCFEKENGENGINLKANIGLNKENSIQLFSIIIRSLIDNIPKKSILKVSLLGGASISGELISSKVHDNDKGKTHIILPLDDKMIELLKKFPVTHASLKIGRNKEELIYKKHCGDIVDGNTFFVQILDYIDYVNKNEITLSDCEIGY